MDDPKTWIALIALCISVIAVIYSRLDRATIERKADDEKLNGVIRDVAVLQEKMEVFWKSVSVNFSQALHSPHTPELDLLLEKTHRGEELDMNEAIRMLTLLNKIIGDPKESDRRKDAARMLYAVTKAKYYLVT